MTSFPKVHVFPSFLNIGPNIHERLPIVAPEKFFVESAGSILMVVSPVSRIQPKLCAGSFSDIREFKMPLRRRQREPHKAIG